MLLLSAIYRFGRNLPRGKAVRVFRQLQRFSAAYMAFSHGRNDAQKPMGVLAMAVAMLGNTAAHVVASAVTRTYSPGIASAVLLMGWVPRRSRIPSMRTRAVSVVSQA